MEELHREKARNKELLKCCKVRLKQEDLAQVEEDLDGGKLEYIPVFFAAWLMERINNGGCSNREEKTI